MHWTQLYKDDSPFLYHKKQTSDCKHFKLIMSYYLFVSEDLSTPVCLENFEVFAVEKRLDSWKM